MQNMYPPAPACRGHQAARHSVAVTGHKSQVHFVSNCYWMTYRSANLCFEGLQVSKLGFTGLLLYPLDSQFTINFERPLNLRWFWGGSEFH